MGKATNLENIRWRANLLLEEGEPEEIKELAELIIGLVDAIESVPDSLNQERK